MCHHDRNELAEWTDLYETEEDDPLAESMDEDEREPDVEDHEPVTPSADD